MSRIIRRSERETIVEHTLHYQYSGQDTLWGFGFPCDENGVVNEAELPRSAYDSLQECKEGSVDGWPVDAPRLITRERTVTHPAVLECNCGNELALHNPIATPCECGREYNGAGQRLAPREQWGEETGETASDILINQPYPDW